MAYFDQTKETELITDASPFGLSAILTQNVQGSDQRNVVAYISRSLSDDERRYCLNLTILLRILQRFKHNSSM